MKYLQPFVLLLIFSFTACIESVKNNLPKEKEHPKLIKTIGSPNYGQVSCGLQDKFGNLWFGTTENGLYKYDGKTFRQFLEADGLSSNHINDILEAKDGKIWIGTEDGLTTYDGKTFNTIKIPLPKNLPPNNSIHYKTQIVQDILQDKLGKLWFATIYGVYVYDGISFTFFKIDDKANGFLSQNNKAEHILEDKAGNIWFGGRTNKGVYRYDGKTVTNFKLNDLIQDGPMSKPHSWAWPQLQDKDGNIWFSNWGGAYRYDGKSFISFSKKDGLYGGVTKIIEDKKGNIWFGASGLFRYDGKTFTRFTAKNKTVNTGIWSILEDNIGNLWMGTWQTSLYLFDGKTFYSYSEYKH